MNRSDTRGGASIGLGVVLVALGALFLLEQFFDFGFGHWLWPFFVLVPGLLFFVGMLLGGKSAGGLAIPGTIVTTIGLLLLYQNTFNHFESWAYAWALIPLAVGAGMIIQGIWSERPAAVENGRRVAGIGLALFLIGFVFFELVLNIGGFGGGILAPLLLIGGGLYLLWRNLAARAAPVASIRPAGETAPPPAPPAAEPRGVPADALPIEAAPTLAAASAPADEPSDAELVERAVGSHEGDQRW
jgi:hypothetical protein